MKQHGGQLRTDRITNKTIQKKNMTNFYNIRRQERTLSYDKAFELLQNAEYGFLSLGESKNGYAYGVPISFFFDMECNALYFHCALEGHKLENIRRNNCVSFCVVGKTQTLPEKFATIYESVIVFGKAEIATTDEEKRIALTKLLEKYSPDHLDSGIKYMEHAIHKTLTFKIKIDKITAKGRLS